MAGDLDEEQVRLLDSNLAATPLDMFSETSESVYVDSEYSAWGADKGRNRGDKGGIIGLRTKIVHLFGMLTLDHLRWLLIRVCIGAAVAFWLLLISVVGYLALYKVYMPVMQLNRPVYFNFDGSSPPTALLDLSPAPFPMRKGVAYDFILELDLPDIPELSEGLGNFMACLELGKEAGSDQYWLKASRPVLLPFRSQLARVTITGAKLIPLVFGWTEERINQRVFLAESVSAPPDIGAGLAKVRIELSNPRIPLYASKLHITAHLQGIRYWLYHWRLTSAFAIISGLFWSQLSGIITLWLIWTLARRGSAAASTGHVSDLPNLKFRQPRRRVRSKSPRMSPFKGYLRKRRSNSFDGSDLVPENGTSDGVSPSKLD